MNKIQLSITSNNPLDFLGAMGTFRMACYQTDATIHWENGCPIISSEDLTEDLLLETIWFYLHDRLKPFLDECLSDDNMPTLKRMSQENKRKHPELEIAMREKFDYLEEVVVDNSTEDLFNGMAISPPFQVTKFDFSMGQSHLIKNVLNLYNKCIGNDPKSKNFDRIVKALFGPSPIYDKGNSLRFDPHDIRHHAYVGVDPSSKSNPVNYGLNLLAFIGLSMFPVFPNNVLGITGKCVGYIDSHFSWPIWNCPVHLNTLKSLLPLSEIQQEQPNCEILNPMGIDEVYRCEYTYTGTKKNAYGGFSHPKRVM